MLIRFLVGGVVVSTFAVLGDIFRPKSFAGLFGAAPSVALATLGLTLSRHSRSYVALETRTMIAGAVAFFVFASCVSFLMMRYRMRAWLVTISLIPLWLALALGLEKVGL